MRLLSSHCALSIVQLNIFKGLLTATMCFPRAAEAFPGFSAFMVPDTLQDFDLPLP